MIRRLISFVAAIALFHAMAAPAFACQTASMDGRKHANAMPMDDTVADMRSDCPPPDDSETPGHSPECVTACLSMIGCSVLTFVAESVPVIVDPAQPPLPVVIPLPQASRTVAPDRPPPRA